MSITQSNWDELARLRADNERLRAERDTLKHAADTADAISAARLEKIERLREALTAIAEGGLGDEPWNAGYDCIREFARAALAASPGEQG